MSPTERDEWLRELEAKIERWRLPIAMFREQVYERGLRAKIDACPQRGMSGTFGGVDLRSFVLSGRVMITCEGHGGSVSIVGQSNRDNPRFGLQSVEGGEEKALALLGIVAQHWTPDAAFGADSRLSLGSAEADEKGILE